MKNFVIVFLIIIVITLDLSAQDIGYFSVGSNILHENLNSNNLGEGDLHAGLNIHFILPVRLPFLNLYYKGDMTYHRLNSYDDRCNRNNFISDSAFANRGFDCTNHRISSLNELMLCLQNNDHGSFYVQTFIGFGIMATTTYGSGSSTYGSYVFDLTNYFMFESDRFDKGFYFSVLYEPFDGNFNGMRNLYFNVGFSITK